MGVGARMGGWPHLKSGCPIFGAVSSRLRWAIVRKHDPVISDTSDLDTGRFVVQVVTKRRPAPAFRFLYKTPNNRIAVHVLQLFNPLIVGKDVEVVVTRLPEGSLAETLRDRELEGLERLREGDLALQRFTDEEMDVLRHDDVPEDFKGVASAGEFEGVEEDVS
jgi:hypothetical protein